MKVSLNQVQQYLSFELPDVDELVEIVNQQLGGVEEIIDLASKYQDALIVKVSQVEPHPNADRLSVTMIDDGGQLEFVDRDDQGLVQVVCGAPNVSAGMYAIWLPPGSTVPSTYDDSEPFVLAPKELRGVVSNGMLAAADELDLGDDHSGIISIEPNDLPATAAGELDNLVGQKFADVFGLHDTVIDIENKMFTHRPDLFGQIGVAREISAILQSLPPGDHMTEPGQHSPQWYRLLPQFSDQSGLELELFNDVTDSVQRFMAVAVKDIAVVQSPLWLKCALVAMGAKPINSIVDATNYIMLLTAQPVHAYDYHKLQGQTIGARFAKKGESIKLLNEKTYQLDQSDIVIADAAGPVGLGGVMGGFDSQVTADTKAIVLEVANFDMYQSRRTSMRHGLFTDAVTRFSKGQSPIQANRVMFKLLELVGGQQASPVLDKGSQDWRRIENFHPSLRVSADFVSQRLGHDFSPYLISNMLRLVGFTSWIVEGTSDTLEVYAPFWRTDIELPEDIVEEIGRLYGFDKLPRKLPRRSIKPAANLVMVTLQQQLRQRLKQAGANEVLSYSFVNAKLLDNAGQTGQAAYTINNALSPDLQHYRLSLTPSLLDKLHPNIKAGHDQFALFEIGKIHSKNLPSIDGLPAEPNHLALTLAANHADASTGAAFYSARNYLTTLLTGYDLEFRQLSQQILEQSADYLAPYQPERSALVYVADQLLGVVGEFKPSVSKKLKLPGYSAGFEINLDDLLAIGGIKSASYQPLSRYPSSERDISFKVDQQLAYGQLLAAIEPVIDQSDYQITVQPLDIYQAEASQTKNISLRFKFTASDQTLTSQQINQLVDALVERARSQVAAEVV